MGDSVGMSPTLEHIALKNMINMIAETRTSSYVRMDDWDIEAKKWFERKAEQKQAS